MKDPLYLSDLVARRQLIRYIWLGVGDIVHLGVLDLLASVPFFSIGIIAPKNNIIPMYILGIIITFYIINIFILIHIFKLNKEIKILKQAKEISEDISKN